MKNCSRLEMMKVFVTGLNSDVVKNSEWIYGSKKKKKREKEKVSSASNDRHVP